MVGPQGESEGGKESESPSPRLETRCSESGADPSPQKSRRVLVNFTVLLLLLPVSTAQCCARHAAHAAHVAPGTISHSVSTCVCDSGFNAFSSNEVKAKRRSRSRMRERLEKETSEQSR